MGFTETKSSRSDNSKKTSPEKVNVGEIAQLFDVSSFSEERHETPLREAQLNEAIVPRTE